MLSVGLYLLTTNAHVDFFPGTTFEKDWETGMVTSSSDGMVSLLTVSRGDAELNFGGYLVAFLFIIGLPALISFLIAKKLNKGRVRTT